MIDVDIRDWMLSRTEITSRCSRIDLAGDNGAAITYPRITVAEISHYRNKDLDGKRNDRKPRLQIDVYAKKGQSAGEIAEVIEDELDAMLLGELGGLSLLDVDVENVSRPGMFGGFSSGQGPAKGQAEAIDRVTIDVVFVLS